MDRRVDSLGVVASIRLALRPFTFCNGVTIPADTLVALPLYLPNPEEFDGFRFSELREKEGDVAATKQQAVTTSAELLAFGIGRHAYSQRNQGAACLYHCDIRVQADGGQRGPA
ncbi:hypothetical protein BJV74DRAFT_831546 [Russula compacta]|nr:hypothetical protein BJV74DRAFT_831546 [Russula compacta]